MRSILSVFRFREAERIEEFLRHILSDDEISIMRAMIFFHVCKALLIHEEKLFDTPLDGWTRKEQIAIMDNISIRAIYRKDNCLTDLIKDDFILEHKRAARFRYITYYRLNVDIPIILSYVRSILDCFRIA